jgi:RepB plasmid partitioning protein
MQHFMLIRALENGVSEERLADALNIQVKNIRRRRNLLKGICPEGVDLLRHRQVAFEVFSILGRMKPVPQVEAAEHTIAGSTFSTLFAKSLLAVTRPEFLVQPTRRPDVLASSRAAQEILGNETAQLIRDLKAIEDSYGQDALSFTVCCGYFKRILSNPRVESHLSRNHSGLLGAVKIAISER